MTNKPNTQDMVDNILAYWNVSTPTQREQGAQWYAEANALALTLAAQSGTNVDTAAAVISHLSPKTSWARNVQTATSLMLHGDAPGAIGANVARARVAIASDDPLGTFGPTAKKTQAFARNILGDTDAVTVDVWALRIATGSDDRKVINRKGGYAKIAEAYRIAARHVGVTPATMQATTWIVARNGRVG